MPIYEVKVPGAEKPRMIQAKDVAAALAGIVEVKAISAERMIELNGAGVTVEKPKPDASDPASHAPGGALHNAAGGSAGGGEDAGGDASGKGAGKETGKAGKEG